MRTSHTKIRNREDRLASNRFWSSRIRIWVSIDIIMFRISNILVALLNSCTLLIGLVAISTSIFFHFSGDATECQRVLQFPLLIVGVFVFILSLLGVVGACFRLNFVIYIYLFFLFLIIIGLICFTVFTLLVTNRGVGYAVSRHEHKEYRLADFTHWLQRYVLNTNHWDKIRSCLVDSQICQRLEDHDTHHKTSFGFYIKNMSPIQSGCCKPPLYCGFIYKNATFWEIPKSGPVVPDSDCTTWGNQQEKLCYDCKSCKVGVLDNIRKEWKFLAIFNSCGLISIIIIYCIGCCATKNHEPSKLNYIRYKGQP